MCSLLPDLKPRRGDFGVVRLDFTPRIRAREKYLAPVHAKTCCVVTGGRRTFPEKRKRRVAETTRPGKPWKRDLTGRPGNWGMSRQPDFQSPACSAHS